MKVLSATQMREVDRLSTDRYGIPTLLLMESAGSGVVAQMEKRFKDLQSLRLLVVCGKGNNGGDGLVVARHLRQRGIETRVLLCAAIADVKGEALTNLKIVQNLGIPLHVLDDPDSSQETIRQALIGSGTDLVVDALLGTGFRPPVGERLARIISEMNAFRQIVSIDVPSGSDSDSTLHVGDSDPVVKSTFTITFTAPKPIHAFASADSPVGDWVVIPIGSPADLVNCPAHWLNHFTRSDAARTLSHFRRRPESHKGDFGHLLVIAGSLGKTGASVMTSRAALLAGAGLVTLATPASCLPIVASQAAEIMTEPLAATEVGTISNKAFDYGRFERLSEGKDLIALGPGLGSHAETADIIRRVVEQTQRPLVLDADGINAFAGSPHLLRGVERTVVLTPHAGEFARLLSCPISDLLRNRVELARRFSLEHLIHVVLKGHRTIYASPSGQVYVNPTGNPAMAKGGSGDVLTGVLASVLMQGMNRFGNSLSPTLLEEMIALSVYLHGCAGDLAAQERGEHSVLAGDLMDKLSYAFMRLGNKSSIA